jgi:phosphate-selective porin
MRGQRRSVIGRAIRTGLMGLGVAVALTSSGTAQTVDASGSRSATEGSAAQDATAPNPFRPTIRFYGFAQAHYRHAFETGDDGVFDAPNFRMQRVRLGVRGDLHRWLSYEIEIDPRSPEIMSVLRDAFLLFRVIPRHEIRLGQQKTQFGYENRESSSDLFVVNRSELSDALSRGVNLRDIGVGLIGNIRLGTGWRFEDAVTVVNGDGMNVQADRTRQKNLWARAGLRYRKDSADFTVRLGVSHGRGDQMDEGIDQVVDTPDDFRLEFDRLGTDVQIDHRRFFASGEYVRGTNTDTRTDEDEELSGYYVNLVGKTPWKIGPTVRLDTFADEFRRWTIGGYYGLPNVPFRLMVNYERRQLKDGVRGDDKLYVWTQVRF